MTLIKFNQIAQASGKIGGSVYAKVSGGTLKRTLGRRSTKKSHSQSTYRNNFSNVARAWQGLTEEQRNSWFDFSVIYFKINRVGDRVARKGFQVFQEYNTNRLECGYSLEANSPVQIYSSLAQPITLSVAYSPQWSQLKALVTLSETVSSGTYFSLIFESTGTISPGVKFLKNKFKKLLVYPITLGGISFSVDLYSAYLSVFGLEPNASSTIFFRVSVVYKDLPIKLQLFEEKNSIVPYWFPTSLSGCQVWYQGGECTLVSGKVAIVADLTGNFRHLTQTTSGYRPTIESAYLNGKDCIYYMGLARFLRFPISWGVTKASFTIFVLCKQMVNSRKECVISNQGNQFNVYLPTVGASVLSVSYEISPASNCLKATPLGWVFMEFKHDGVNNSVTFNGVKTVMPNGSGSGAFGQIWLGAMSNTGAFPWLGYFAEVFAYSRALSDAESVLCQNYIKAMYGLSF